MTDRVLIALLDGDVVGRVLRDRNGRMTFVYEDSWRSSAESYPLSLSMPLAAAEHPHAKIDAFLWGLLPDNANILDRWARRFRVSARNPFALLAHVGEDCAGAVQFATPERIDALVGAADSPIEWLDEQGVADRLAALRVDQAAWRIPEDTGQFSLAGAQPKTALLYRDGHWAVPSGRVPTSHILKPPSSELDGHAENEYFCLALARSLALPAANAEVVHFGNEVAIVIERYDRIAVGGALHRVHQEDACQALGCPPTSKYENERGPGAKDIVELLRTYSSARDEDIDTFIGALIFNWLIAGTDAHAKNYSLLLASGGEVRLAPLYDVASALPYEGLNQDRLTLAMKLGNHYRLRDISFHDWEKLAQAVRIDSNHLFARINVMIEELPNRAAEILGVARRGGLTHSLLERLVGDLAARSAACKRIVAHRRSATAN